MIYTITSTLPQTHGGRTKVLLKRIQFLKDALDIDQTILTTNYNADYPNIYTTFLNAGKLYPDTPIINLYDWLSDYTLFADTPHHVIKHTPQRISPLKYKHKKDTKKDVIRYFERVTNKYYVYRKFYAGTKQVKFDDFFKPSIKHKIMRYEYTRQGALHRTTYFSHTHNLPVEEIYYTPTGDIYCRKHFEDSKKNTLQSITTYDKNGDATTFKTEKALFKYFFDAHFNHHDIVFNDARLLDGALLETSHDIQPVLVYHSSHLLNNKIKKRYKISLRAFEKVAKFVLLTTHQKQDIQSQFNIPDEKFAVIPNFITPSMHEQNAEEVCDQFVYIGRFGEEKQLHHIIEAYRLFKQSGHTTKLVLYGATEPIRSTLIDLIDAYDLTKDVTIHGFTHEAHHIFKQSRASLLTSKFEGFPLSIIESIDAGCPVIAYDIRYGPRDIIIDGQNGMLVEPNNIDAFAHAMIKMVEQPLEHVANHQAVTYDAAISNYKNLFNALSYNA